MSETGESTSSPSDHEFGFRRALNVVSTRPGDWEEAWFDLSDSITRINRAKANCAALNEEGPMTHWEREGCVILSRATNDGSSRAMFVVNPSKSVGAHINIESLVADLGYGVAEIRDAMTDESIAVAGLTVDIGPLHWRILASHGGTPTAP